MNIQKRGVEGTSSLVVVLIILAVILSLISISINIKNQGVSITGRTSYYGNVTTEIDNIVECILTESPVDFGVIGLGVENDTSNDNPMAFRIENNGSVQVDVALNSTKVPGTFFQSTNPIYQYKSSCVEAGCAGDLITEWTSFTAVQATIASALWMNASSDLMRFDIKIKAPLDEPAGAKSDTLTFTCSEAGEFGGGEPEKELPSVMFAGEPLYIYYEDSSASIKWDDVTCEEDEEFFTIVCDTTGAQSNVNGSENTQKIVNQLGAGIYAAKLCHDLVEEGYNDWYLPARDQLEQMYIQWNNESLDKGDYVVEWEDLVGTYWSSTEDWGASIDTAWYLDLVDGTLNQDAKWSSYRIRCVRSD